jgi:hypothetical protein
MTPSGSFVGTGCACDDYLSAFAKFSVRPGRNCGVNERTLQKLSLVDRNDPLTETIAKKIIELGQRGVRDARQLSELAIKELGLGL